MFSRHTQTRPWLFALTFPGLMLSIALVFFLFVSRTADAAVSHVNVVTLKTPADTFYSFLFDPNIVFLLFIVAMIGLCLEMSHPGSLLPGIAGSIALLLFFFLASALSPNWVGLALMFLALALLVLDVKFLTHGVLTIGAVISLILGSMLFFNDEIPSAGSHVDPLVVYTMGVVIGLIGFTLVGFAMRAHRQRVTNGVEGMIGAKVIALTPLLPEGRVSYGGENWAAILEPPTTSADPGSVLQIISVERLRLHVQPARNQPLADRRGPE